MLEGIPGDERSVMGKQRMGLKLAKEGFHNFLAAVFLRLFRNIVDVHLDCPDGDAQFVCDLAVRMTAN